MANEFDGTLSVIETASNTVVATAPAGPSPFEMAITPDGAFIYVTNLSTVDRSVSVVETASNTLVATVGVGSLPSDVAITPDGAFVYVANEGSSTVSVIETSTNNVIATIPVVQPRNVAITPDGAFAYITRGRPTGQVSVIETATNTVDNSVFEPWKPEGCGDHAGWRLRLHRQRDLSLCG
ncbi:MAG: YncE family protein [Planctomycetota bacterium]